MLCSTRTSSGVACRAASRAASPSSSVRPRKLGQLVVVQRRHDQAAPVARQHRLRFQPLQRFAHRGAADAQPLGQLAFDQPVAGLVDPGLDGFQDQRIGVFLHGVGLPTFQRGP
jgi:hypothetical protein